MHRKKSPATRPGNSSLDLCTALFQDKNEAVNACALNESFLTEVPIINITTLNTNT